MRSDYRLPGKSKSLPEADAIVVAPRNFNSVNKSRAGIARQHGPYADVLACMCGCDRRIRVARLVLDMASILCGGCSQQCEPDRT